MTSENHSNAQQPAPSADEVTNAGIVKEYTTPLKHEIDPDINLFDFLEGRAQRNPDGSMVSYKDANGIWQTFSATEFRDKVADIARTYRMGRTRRRIRRDHRAHPLGVGCS